MKRVIIESPYAGDRITNERYLLDCMRDSLSRGEAPFASHLLYTAVLEDANPDERKLGVEAGFAWGEAADYVVVCTDRGLTRGMVAGIERASKARQPVVYRSLGAWFGKPHQEGSLTDSGVTRAPWTPEFVERMREHQTRDDLHGYTCGNRGDGNHANDGLLVPSTDGWRCLYCPYTQDWAHSMSDPPRRRLIAS